MPSRKSEQIGTSVHKTEIKKLTQAKGRKQEYAACNEYSMLFDFHLINSQHFTNIVSIIESNKNHKQQQFQQQKLCKV